MNFVATDVSARTRKASITIADVWRYKNTAVVALSIVAIGSYLLLRFAFLTVAFANIPLLICLAVGGVPLVVELLQKAWRREFGSDLLAGISIVTSALLGEYLAGSIVVLMLSGGAVLESYALRSASSVLAALAKRMPSVAHRKRSSGGEEDVALLDVKVGDELVIHPHDICPVDGVVLNGHGTMDESFLTGEPFKLTKTIGSAVISGAINGESVLTIRAEKLAADSRYAKIMVVMKESEATRPNLRRLGDQLGAIYTPLAVAVAVLAWVISGEAHRFLAVLVIATPCPLLIAIPVAIIGSISLCARRAIIVKSPVVLEKIAECRTAIFDKTGTLTYGEPTLAEQVVATGFTAPDVLTYAAGLERYSRHPLARAILAAAKDSNIAIPESSEVSEPPGQGLRGTVAGHSVQVTSRNKLVRAGTPGAEQLPPVAGGLECVVVIDNRYAAIYRFRDAPRPESRSFVTHLGPKHHLDRVMIVSGDRESEVRYLADQVGVREIYAQKTPEEKLEIVRSETAKASTLYVGDGINDAPAMMAATVGMAIGQNSDVTTEAAGVVVMENSLKKVDEFMHIARRMRTIALQSAIGGMLLSVVGMALAASGAMTPVQGAISQEVIDVLAVLNALRAAMPPRVLSDV